MSVIVNVIVGWLVFNVLAFVGAVILAIARGEFSRR